MPIHDVVLFVSSTSHVCVSPVQFVRQHKLPVRLVRLDTLADRQAAQNGKYFQIHAVPTLLVTYSDGNVQLFAGQEKVLMWLQQASASQEPEIISPPVGSISSKVHNVNTSIESDEYEESQIKKPSVKSKTPKTKKSKGSTKTKSSGGMYEGKTQQTKKKKPPVQFTEISEEENSSNEDDIVFIDSEKPSQPPLPKLSSSQKTKRESKMTNLYDIAKQMEKDRQYTLGYKDEDIPKT